VRWGSDLVISVDTWEEEEEEEEEEEY